MRAPADASPRPVRTVDCVDDSRRSGRRPARVGQTTISPHSLAYYAVGGGICCREDPENGLVPGPTGSYDSSGLTRNAQVRSSNLLPGSKKRCNCKGFEKFDARSRCGRATYGPQTGSLSNTRDCRRRSVRTAPGVPVGDRLWAVRPMGPRALRTLEAPQVSVWNDPLDSGVLTWTPGRPILGAAKGTSLRK